jgi:hypothetical protein
MSNALNNKTARTVTHNGHTATRKFLPSAQVFAIVYVDGVYSWRTGRAAADKEALKLVQANAKRPGLFLDVAVIEVSA